MFFISALNAMSSCRMFHSSNIAELEEAITWRSERATRDRETEDEKSKSAENASRSKTPRPA